MATLLKLVGVFFDKVDGLDQDLVFFEFLQLLVGCAIFNHVLDRCVVLLLGWRHIDSTALLWGPARRRRESMLVLHLLGRKQLLFALLTGLLGSGHLS
jgi:hypothetical protein